MAEIWGAVAFTEFENWETADGLIRATIEGLEAQHLITEAATSEDVQTLYRLWPWPMYDINFKPIKISLADLKEEQDTAILRKRLGRDRGRRPTATIAQNLTGKIRDLARQTR